MSGGVHPDFRRNHAKGVCATGTFESSGQAASLCKATVFKQGRMPDVARFSFGGGMPFMKDDSGAAREPVKLVGPLVLPPIMPHDQMLYAGLRGPHTVPAYLLS